MPIAAATYRLGLAVLFLFSLILRCWGLGRFNQLVFDEVHFAKFAMSYLHGLPFLENHPPLGKYFIAGGIWLSQFFPAGDQPPVMVAGYPVSAIGYRWSNALLGALIPPTLAWLALEIWGRRRLALIAGGFAALDGLLLVESRYALINIHLVLFGLLGHALLLHGLSREGSRRGLWLVLAGIALGAAVAVKWSGLGFLLGLYGTWAALKLAENWRDFPADRDPGATPLSRLRELGAAEALLYLVLIPALVYTLAWLPHLRLNHQLDGFRAWHEYALASHRSIGSGPREHPYCSDWQTWPLLKRPMAVYFTQERQPASSDPEMLTSAARTVVTDVHDMGNPVLWWLSTAAIAALIGGALRQAILLTSRLVPEPDKRSLLAAGGFWAALYLTWNYLANLLPWALVSRCVFIYHYMEAAVFSFLALAWLTDRALRSTRSWRRGAGLIVLTAVGWAFLYWLPLYLGLPLSAEEFHARMWLRSWY